MKHKIIALFTMLGFVYVIANDIIVNDRANDKYEEALTKQITWEQTLNQ